VIGHADRLRAARAGVREEAGTLVHHPGLRLDSRFPEVDWVYGAYGACRAIGYAME